MPSISSLSKMLLIAAFIQISVSKAQCYFEFNGYYFTKDQKTDEILKSTDMNYEIALGYSIDKAKRYKVGWSYLGIQEKISGSLETKYASTHMGPKFLVSLDKEHKWVVGLSYLLSSQLKLSENSADYSYKGNSIKADLGYQILVGDWLRLSMRLNYIQSSWTERLDSSDQYLKTSHKKSVMWPSLGVLFIF